MSFGIYCQQVAKFRVPKPFQWELCEKKLVTSFDHNSDEVPDSCWYEIKLAINRDCYPYRFDVSECTYYIGHEYVVPRGEYCGSLVKRLRKYLHKTMSPEVFALVTNDLLGEIGSIVGEYQNAKVQFDFTDCLDWCDGDFGDEGSCYFNRDGCRHWLPDKLMEHGCHAIRFYDADNRGIARALLLPRGHDTLVFNSYGFTLLKTTRILATILGMSYRRVLLSNDGGTTGDLYLNNHGESYVIASCVDEYSTDCPTRIELRLDCSNKIECECCASRIDPDSAIIVDGDSYCRDCVNYCDSCEEYVTGDTTTVHTSRTRTQEVCESCLDNYTCCPCCEEYFEQ